MVVRRYNVRSCLLSSGLCVVVVAVIVVTVAVVTFGGAAVAVGVRVSCASVLEMGRG